MATRRGSGRCRRGTETEEVVLQVGYPASERLWRSVGVEWAAVSVWPSEKRLMVDGHAARPRPSPRSSSSCWKQRGTEARTEDMGAAIVAAARRGE